MYKYEKEKGELYQYAKRTEQNINNPGELAVIADELAVRFAYWSEELGHIKSDLKPNVWAELKFKKDGEWRDKPRSDNITEQLWRLTEAGKRETKLRYNIKGAEKLLASIKSHIVVLSIEAKNQI